MTTYSHTVRVRYAECDRMGFVHHSVFALYYEEARTEILRKLGITYKSLEDEGIIMPVKSMSFQFKKAALYDDLLKIELKLQALKGLRCHFEYEIFNQHNESLSTGQTELFFVRKADMRPVKIPERILKAFGGNL